MQVVFAETGTVVETTFSLGSILLIVLPSTIALVGVIVSTIVSSATTHRAEDRRARNLIYAQVLEAGRQAELEALYATAAFIAKLKAFNHSMSGNSGKGKDDKRSAQAFVEFVESFDGLDSLTRAAVTVEALGATAVSELVKTVRARTLEYVMSLRVPNFSGTHAQEFEAEVDCLMEDLLDAVREDFRTDDARRGYQGNSKALS